MMTASTPNPSKLISEAFSLFEVAVSASVQKLDESALIPCSTTSYFLLGTSIELALLGFLSYRGFGRDELAHINHDLEIAFDKAIRHGLSRISPLTEEYLTYIRELNSQFKFQNIEKADFNSEDLQGFDLMEKGTGHLLKGIAREIGIAM